MRDAREHLGPILWFFIVFKAAGMLLNLAFLALLGIWVLPVVARIDDGESLVPKLLTEGVLPVVEIVASAVGILLILKRSRNVRRFWIVVLSLCCLVQVMEVVVGLESEGALFFLGSGMAWLLYWSIAKKPRELQLAAFRAKG